MKKFMLILVVLFVFASCASPVDEVEVEPVNPFEGRWMAPNGYITEWRGSNIIHPDGNIYQTFWYDETYLYQRFTEAGYTHLVKRYKYEFKDNGNMLYLYFSPNVYFREGDGEDGILQRIGD